MSDLDLDYEADLDARIQDAEDAIIDRLVDSGEWSNWDGHAS